MDALPWEAEERQFVPTFSVGELLVTSLDGLLTAAALHMGDKLADGRGLRETDATECWLALLGAAGLLVELAPVLRDEVKRPYEAILADLLQRYGEAFPDRKVPTPNRPIGSLRGMLEQAWQDVAGEPEAPAVEEVAAPPLQAEEVVPPAAPPRPSYFGASTRPFMPGNTGPIRLSSNPPDRR